MKKVWVRLKQSWDFVGVAMLGVHGGLGLAS